MPGGHSFTGYVENVSRDFFANLNDDERAQVLTQGSKWPSSALSVLAKFPDDPGTETLAQLQSLDRNLESMSGEPVRRLRIGIVAVLGHSGNAGRPSLSARTVRPRSGAARVHRHGLRRASRRRKLAGAGEIAVDRWKGRSPSRCC